MAQLQVRGQPYWSSYTSEVSRIGPVTCPRSAVLARGRSEVSRIGPVTGPRSAVLALLQVRGQPYWPSYMSEVSRIGPVTGPRSAVSAQLQVRGQS